jgi:hypothetical protein
MLLSEKSEFNAIIARQKMAPFNSFLLSNQRPKSAQIVSIQKWDSFCKVKEDVPTWRD